MATYTIELSDIDAHRIQELAKDAGLAVEELLRRGVSEWLAKPSRDFSEAASYVLEKNADLYKRLS